MSEKTPERFAEIIAQAKAHVPESSDLTTDQLLACLAEGQACVMDYATTSLHLDRRTRFPNEAKKLEADNAAAFQRLLAWAFDRDDMSKRPRPLKLAWEFRLRVFDEARADAIKNLEDAIATLKAQQPKEP